MDSPWKLMILISPSIRSELGVQLSRAISTNFGVVLPYVGATWVHEFEDRGSDIQARFVVDPYSEDFDQLAEDLPGGNNRPTLFIIPGDENDSKLCPIFFRLFIQFSKQQNGLAFYKLCCRSGRNKRNSIYRRV